MTNNNFQDLDTAVAPNLRRVQRAGVTYWENTPAPLPTTPVAQSASSWPEFPRIADTVVPVVPVAAVEAPRLPTATLRIEIGDVLRTIRTRQGRTLRDVSSAGLISLGYLSELERGRKEVSSELLGAVCEALGVPLAIVMFEVAERIAEAEGLKVPDTIPADFATV